ncbi:MAG: site-specific integrase [Bacteroidota bacterium]|nr:site-specific integrase [Bacteroidota bacterium]
MASIKIKLFKGKTLSDGRHPVVLQIIDDKRVRKIALELKAFPEEWNEGLSRFSNTHRSYRKHNQILEHFEQKAEKIQQELILENKPFSFELFRSRFLGSKKSSRLLEFLSNHVQILGEQGKLSTQSAYQSTFNVLKEFTRNQEISFYSVDYEFLVSFEKFLFQRGSTEGGVHHHMRNVRAIFNEAIRKGYCESEYYPFSHKHNEQGYSLSRVKSKAKPQSLSDQELERFKNLPLEKYPELVDSHMYFMFSYYTRGMNFNDMARLTRRNLKGGRIVYQRRKTGTTFSIKEDPRIKSILSHFYHPGSTFLFPILNSQHKTERQQKDRIHKCLRKFNRDLRKIGELIDASIPITSYTARHTWASTLKRKGISTEIISEGLGHSEITTTKAYLENFNEDILDQTSNYL